MNFPAANGYVVELTQVPHTGTPWIVRVYKKKILFKKLISSDWFLNEEQAKQFAEQLRRELGESGTSTLIKERTPGWTLRRSLH